MMNLTVCWFLILCLDDEFDSLLVFNIMFRGSQEILHKRFCALGVKKQTHPQSLSSPVPQLTLFLNENQAAWNNINLMENTYLLCILLQVSKILLIKILKYNYHLFYFVLFYYISLYITRSDFLQIFWNFIQPYLKKYFCHKFSFLSKFTLTPHTLFNSQNLLNIKVFCWCSLMGEVYFFLVVPEYWEELEWSEVLTFRINSHWY